MEVPEANLGAVSYHKKQRWRRRRQKTENRNRVNERGKARLPQRITEAKNLDDDEQKIYEKLTQLNKVTKTCLKTKEHSQRQARRTYPTTGENQKNRKSSANCKPRRTRRTMYRRKKLDR